MHVDYNGFLNITKFCQVKLNLKVFIHNLKVSKKSDNLKINHQFINHQ